MRCYMFCKRRCEDNATVHHCEGGPPPAETPEEHKPQRQTTRMPDRRSCAWATSSNMAKPSLTLAGAETGTETGTAGAVAVVESVRDPEPEPEPELDRDRDPTEEPTSSSSTSPSDETLRLLFLAGGWSAARAEEDGVGGDERASLARRAFMAWARVGGLWRVSSEVDVLVKSDERRRLFWPPLATSTAGAVGESRWGGAGWWWWWKGTGRETDETTLWLRDRLRSSTGPGAGGNVGDCDSSLAAARAGEACACG